MITANAAPTRPAVVGQTADILSSYWGQVGDDAAKDATISLTCDALKGEELTWEDLGTAIGESVASGQIPVRVQQLDEAIVELRGEWEQARASQHPDEQAAVVLICFAIEQF